MQTTRRHSPVPTTLLSLTLVFVVWMLLAPTQLGGQVSYVIVDGNSMETKFHLGDLVLVRKVVSYQIGDAVTYQNAELGRYVFHRIANRNFDRFVLKGDNNGWLDSYQPTQDEIIGKLWVHIPKMGKAIEWLRLPINMAIAFGLLGGSLMSNIMIRPSKLKKSKNSPTGYLARQLEVILYFLGFTTLAFLALSIYAFTRPLTRAAGQIPYQQNGNFFYSATGTPGVYDTAQVHSGEPVFPKLTCFLSVGFAYDLSSDQLHEISGNHQLYARVKDEQSGWQRTIPMVSTAGFVGNSYTTMATLDLCEVEALVGMMEQETGFHQNNYTLEIIPQVDITAKVADQEIHDSFEPRLAFRFDEVHFYLADDNAESDPLHSSKQSLVDTSNLEANILPLLGGKPTVQVMRVIGLIGLAFSLAGLLGAAWYVCSTTHDSQEALIRLRYGSIIMDVHERFLETSSPLIDVSTIDDLARMAERQNTMILHMTLNFMNYYLIQSHGATYRYVTNTSKRAVVKAEPSQEDTIDYLIESDQPELIFGKPIRRLPAGRVINSDHNNHPRLEPTQKVILRYSMNTSRNHSESLTSPTD